jgi:hypothetical protein
MRILSARFIEDLKSGFLAPILQRIQKDATLDLEIRDDSLNIYYRGGNLCFIRRDHDSVYEFIFNTDYTRNSDTAGLEKSNEIITKLPSRVADGSGVLVWVEAFPHIKLMMDVWLGIHGGAEKEFQQFLARENNLELQSSDYFICDLEYANAKARARFDALAVHWPSIAHERKGGKDHRLAIVEMKYGDGALTGRAGIIKHIEDANSACGDPIRLEQIKADAIFCFNQKRDFGLMKIGRALESFGSTKPELVFALAAHDPESSILARELAKVSESDYEHIDIKIAVGGFFGYGLFEQNVYSATDFKKAFQNQVLRVRR